MAPSRSEADARGGDEPAAVVLPPVDDPTAAQVRLLTVRDGALLGGVCAGIARRWRLDAGLVRATTALPALLALVLWLPLFVLLLIAYGLAALVLPREDRVVLDTEHPSHTPSDR